MKIPPVLTPTIEDLPGWDSGSCLCASVVDEMIQTEKSFIYFDLHCTHSLLSLKVTLNYIAILCSAMDMMEGYLYILFVCNANINLVLQSQHDTTQLIN